MVIEGALAVQCAALVRHSLAWKYIEQGLLVKIGDIEVRSSYSYWLCAPAAYFKRDKVVNFARWIKNKPMNFGSRAWKIKKIAMLSWTQMKMKHSVAARVFARYFNLAVRL